VEDTLSDISTLPYLPRSPRYSPTDPVVCTFFLGGWGGGLTFVPRFIFFFFPVAVLRERLGVHVQPLRIDAPQFFFIEKTPKNNKK
jgi:hypothetical protein